MNCLWILLLLCCYGNNNAGGTCCRRDAVPYRRMYAEEPLCCEKEETKSSDHTDECECDMNIRRTFPNISPKETYCCETEKDNC